jgi:tetratricopeptide (TPR) repeat protein
MDDALALNEFGGLAFRDVNPNRITYDEMISTGKLYYLSNQELVNEIIGYYEIIESYIYQLRQSRVEFRSNFFNLSTMSDFWLTFIDNANEELAYSFANNQTAESYKHLKIISSWSLANTKQSKESIANLYSKASQLQKIINKELEHSLTLTDDSKPSDENTAIIETIELKRISELATDGKDIDAIIEIIKKEDKNQPNYFISDVEINRLAYKLMRQDKNTDALKLFKLNTELYPNEYNVYDSYGECLLKLGDTENGIKAYKKSLELNSDNTNAKIVLSEFE